MFNKDNRTVIKCLCSLIELYFLLIQSTALKFHSSYYWEDFTCMASEHVETCKTFVFTISMISRVSSNFDNFTCSLI